MLTVPKSAKTDRVICYEPHLNIRLQLGVGRHLRSRLMKVGVNLDDQSINQRRATVGAKFGHLATIDLRSASDTVALELVWELLPVEWACLLDDLRSKYTTWTDGSLLKNEKFSSMGNGFTFELESLLFYAICSAVSPNVSVYGDDIVLPTQYFNEALALLEYCGFSANLAKSFNSSYFRESCGEDSFRGVCCTPVYLRKLPKFSEDLFKLHNQVRRFAINGTPWGDARWLPVLEDWRKRTPGPLGPSGYGDGHYHVDLDTACPSRASFWLDGWWFWSFIREYKDHLSSGLVQGHFPARLGFSALCAALGPKRMELVTDSVLDRRRFKYKRTRVLANFCWPGAIWV